MNHLRCTDGTKVSKAYIDRQVSKAKARKVQKQLDDYGYNFCEECKINASSGIYIDCSHDISVNECQNTGRAELAWDTENITIRCRDACLNWNEPEWVINYHCHFDFNISFP